jgi:hypothetical protein
MKKLNVLLSLVVLTACLAAPVLAGEWKGEDDGPFMSLEIIETKPYGVPAYLEYLGKGYIPMLAAAKEAGHVVDYGVLTGVTGNAGDGNVMIWWMAESMDAFEKASDLMGEKAQEMRSPEEWKEMTDAMEKVRKPLASRILRVVNWTPAEAEGGEE